MYNCDAVGELVTIAPEMVFPAHATPADPPWPSPIIGMILEIDDYAITHREAKVHIITDIPGMASRICWVPVDHLDYLDTTNA